MRTLALIAGTAEDLQIVRAQSQRPEAMKRLDVVDLDLDWETTLIEIARTGAARHAD